MADSDAVRARRHRQHRQGDHSACRHPRPVLAPILATPDLSESGGDFDAVAMMRDLAGRLKAAYLADPGNAGLARELRLTLLAIEPDAEPEWDPIKALQLDEWESRRRERERED